jgi:hypothetical protein
MRAGVQLVATATALVLAAAPVAAHHVGTYTPRDNEVSANFKQLKYSIQAGKFDIALQRFETGAVRKQMQALGGRLPAGLEDTVASALRARNGAEAERGLMILFAALARDLALEAERQVTDPASPLEARAAAGRKFLEAIWRYYSLVDFAVTQHDAKAAVVIRLAYDEAEGYVKDPAVAAGNPGAGAKPAGRAEGPRPDKLREPLRRIAATLASIVDHSSTTRRQS